MTAPPRSLDQRKADTAVKLETGGDVWVATASLHGKAHLVPLTVMWHNGIIISAVPANSPTARNAAATQRARIGFGPTRDVVMVDAELEQIVTTSDAPTATANRYAECGWDPRNDDGYVFITFRPSRIQAWRESNEIKGRTVMSDGEWLE